MPATPLTTEARAIAARLDNFSTICGNAQLLRQMVYQDSATVLALKDSIVGTNPAEADALIAVAATCGTVGEGVGNIHLHWLAELAVAPLNAAIAVAEAATRTATAKPAPKE